MHLQAKESQPAESNDFHKLDHPYDTTESPRKLKRKLNDALETVATYKKKLKVSLNKRYRLKKNISWPVYQRSCIGFLFWV